MVLGLQEADVVLDLLSSVALLLRGLLLQQSDAFVKYFGDGDELLVVGLSFLLHGIDLLLVGDLVGKTLSVHILELHTLDQVSDVVGPLHHLDESGQEDRRVCHPIDGVLTRHLNIYYLPLHIRHHSLP